MSGPAATLFALPGWLQDKESRDIADELYEEEDYRERLKREHPGDERAGAGASLSKSAADSGTTAQKAQAALRRSREESHGINFPDVKYAVGMLTSW